MALQWTSHNYGKGEIMKNAITRFATLLIAAVALTNTNAAAQSTSVFTGGLRAPSKIILTQRGNLLVAEMGTGANDGRISLVDATGATRTLVDGLPSGRSPEGAGSGPSGLALRGRTLYVVIGAGDGVVAGPAPGTEAPNFTPSSPLISSVLALRFDGQVEDSGGDFTISPADYTAFLNGARIRLKNSDGERLVADVVINLKNFTFEPRPDFPGNVRASNPYGVAIIKDRLFVVDASQNVLHAVDLVGGDSRTIARFTPKRNTLPFGPPFVDAVPDSVRVFGKQLLVTYLTGFPFPSGQAEVRRINLTNNSQTTVITGLTAAIDVLAVKGQAGEDQFYTLEFSTNMLSMPAAPGRLQFFSSADASPTIIAGGLISPSSMAIDEQAKTIYVSEIFTGRIIKVQIP
jgi:hypothetical protein